MSIVKNIDSPPFRSNFDSRDCLHLCHCTQVKELFDDALKERNEAWDLYGRLGIPDKPKLGFPTLEEVDMKTIHEAYQYLSHKFVDSVASNTAENKKGYVSIDDLKVSFFSKVKFLLVISTTFEFSRQKDDTKLLENNIFQSVSNLKQLIFDIFQ